MHHAIQPFGYILHGENGPDCRLWCTGCVRHRVSCRVDWSQSQGCCRSGVRLDRGLQMRRSQVRSKVAEVSRSGRVEVADASKSGKIKGYLRVHSGRVGGCSNPSHYFLVTPLQCNSLQPSFQSLQLLCFWIRAKPPTHCYLPLRVITESMVNIWELDIIIDIDAGLRT